MTYKFNKRYDPRPDGPYISDCVFCRRIAQEQESATEYMVYCPNGCRMISGKLTQGKEAEQKAAVIAKWNKVNAFRKI